MRQCSRRPATSGAVAIRTASKTLREAFKKELKKAGFGPLARANHAGCLEQCEHGPTVVIYPQGIWYGRVRSRTCPGSWPRRSWGARSSNDLLIADDCLNNPDCPHRGGPARGTARGLRPGRIRRRRPPRRRRGSRSGRAHRARPHDGGIARRPCPADRASAGPSPTSSSFRSSSTRPSSGPHEDFGRYPRTLEDDLAAMRAAGADLVFAPTSATVYPPAPVDLRRGAGTLRRPRRGEPARTFSRRRDGRSQALRDRPARSGDLRSEGLSAAARDPPDGRRPPRARRDRAPCRPSASRTDWPSAAATAI